MLDRQKVEAVLARRFPGFPPYEVAAAANADVLVSVGTSGVVYPAAEIPQVTAKRGGTVIQVNPRPTPLDPFCAVNLRGPAATVLPEIIR